MKTRAHNAALKRLRIINARKAAKGLHETRSAKRKATVQPGDTFDRLTAIELADEDARGQERWVFQCDCGAFVTWRAATARYNARKLGWCSCPECYAAAGGWEAIADRRSA